MNGKHSSEFYFMEVPIKKEVANRKKAHFVIGFDITYQAFLAGYWTELSLQTNVLRRFVNKNQKSWVKIGKKLFCFWCSALRVLKLNCILPNLIEAFNLHLFVVFTASKGSISSSDIKLNAFNLVYVSYEIVKS